LDAVSAPDARTERAMKCADARQDLQRAFGKVSGTAGTLADAAMAFRTAWQARLLQGEAIQMPADDKRLTEIALSNAAICVQATALASEAMTPRRGKLTSEQRATQKYRLETIATEAKKLATIQTLMEV
jgi:hypothetical protein